MKSQRATVLLGCMAFFAISITLVSFGPSLATFAENTGVGLALIGALFTALFLGGTTAQLLTGTLYRRLGPRRLIAMALALTAVGALGVTLSQNLPLALICAVLAGMGQGAYSVANNILAINIFPNRAAVVLNLMNVFYGVGAVLGPALVGLSLARLGTAMAPIWGGAGLLFFVGGLAWLVLPKTIDRVHLPDDRQLIERATSNPYLSTRMWLISGLLLLYVGTETSLSAWASTYIQRTTALGAAAGAWVTSAFWLAVTIGRIIAVGAGMRFPRWLTPVRLVSICLAVAAAGALILVASPGIIGLTILAMAFLGFSFGPVYPTTIASLSTQFPQSSSAATSMAAGLGSLGGMIVPWMQGIVLVYTGPQTGAWVYAVLVWIMLAIQAGLSRSYKPTTPS